MSDYSDLIFLTAAMVIFGMLTVNTAASFRNTSDTMIRSDLEYRAMSIAQDEIENIRWIDNHNLLNEYSSDFLYKNDPVQRTVEYGSSNQFSEVFTVDRQSTRIENSPSQRRYKVVITVKSDALTPEITASMEFIKTFVN